MPNMISRSRRKTKAVKKQWLVEHQINLVLEGLRGRRSVAELCREAGISTARYYQWRQQFLDAARAGWADIQTDHHALKQRMQQLEAENARLQAQVRIFRDLAVAD